jgi:hypothetical protein
MRNVFTLPADLPQLGWIPAYPGMVAEETRPLRAFIQKYAALFDEIRFSVRVGPGETAPADVDASLQRAIEQGTRMRMDCVAWKAPNIATLIEAKKDAGNDAVWQLLAYRDHYAAEHPNESIRLVIVAESATLSARTIAAANGITLALFTFASDTPDVTAAAMEAPSNGPG